MHESTRQAAELERRSRELLAEARGLYQDAAYEDPAAVHGLARLDIRSGDYGLAATSLYDMAQRAGAEPSTLVSIDDELLGPGTSLADDAAEVERDTILTVVTYQADAAAAVLARLSNTLMRVTETGSLVDVDEDGLPNDDGELYTPNFAFPVTVGPYAATLHFDTKGVNLAPMARAMAEMIMDELIAERIPALITGWCPDYQHQMWEWKGAS